MIPGTIPIAGLAPRVELSYRGVYNDDTNGLSYSFSVDIGDAHAKRAVFVGTDWSMDTVTVNGTSLALLHHFSDEYVWGALVPTGSGSVTVAVSRASVVVNHLSIAVWTVKNLRSMTPVDMCGTSAAGTPSDSMSVEAGGVAIAFGASNGGFSNIAFSGITNDGKINNDNSFPIAAGSDLMTTTGTLNISLSSGGSFKAFAAVSMR